MTSMTSEITGIRGTPKTKKEAEKKQEGLTDKSYTTSYIISYQALRGYILPGECIGIHHGQSTVSG